MHEVDHGSSRCCCTSGAGTSVDGGAELYRDRCLFTSLHFTTNAYLINERLAMQHGKMSDENRVFSARGLSWGKKNHHSLVCSGSCLREARPSGSPLLEPNLQLSTVGPLRLS